VVVEVVEQVLACLQLHVLQLNPAAGLLTHFGGQQGPEDRRPGAGIKDRFIEQSLFKYTNKNFNREKGSKKAHSCCLEIKIFGCTICH
jgi:hypothetical protein